MTNNTTKPKTGTVVINGRTYTHKTRCGLFARELDLLSNNQTHPLNFAILDGSNEKFFPYTDQLNFYSSFNESGYDLFPLPATTTRPRELRDIIAELAKGGVPWVKYRLVSRVAGWAVSGTEISEETVIYWNKYGALFSTNPFKENPTILGPEITEELKP